MIEALDVTENYPLEKENPRTLELRQLVFNDLYSFIKLVSPHLYLGYCHEDACKFFTKDWNHKLLLMPRGHLKSKLVAHLAAWLIIRNPAITIIYGSATATLAQAQLYDIKAILECPAVAKYFPQLLNGVAEGKRDKWSTDAFNVEHPLRKKLRPRDNTCKAVGTGAGTTGLHCDVLMLDDITMPNTEVDPWTKTGREKVEKWLSQAASILNSSGTIYAIGTRYHVEDIYNVMGQMKVPVYDKKTDEIVDEVQVYDIKEEVVEKDGEFLWARGKAPSGGYYGFDNKELAKIKAQYIDTAQFFAQYYNDPTDPENVLVDRNDFQYYDRASLVNVGDSWRINYKHLTTFAAMDFAGTITKNADYTALVVVGVDEDGFRYILDIVRKRTDKMSEMVEMVANASYKWGFKKIRMETNNVQGTIATFIEDELRKMGRVVAIDRKASTTNKHLRIATILEPLYKTKSVFHYKGGNCQTLEDELTHAKPAHDDVADACAAAMEIIDMKKIKKTRRKSTTVDNITYHPRFGGVI